MATVAAERRLFRARDGAYIGGVCAGLAERFELDTIVVRVLAVLLALLTFGLAVVVYVALWVHVPLAPESGGPYDVTPESAESSSFGCVDCAAASGERRMTSIPLLARLAIAVGLMLLFLAVATGISPFVPGTEWWQFWPLAFLMAGLCLIVVPVRSSREAAWHAAGIALTAASASILPMSLGIMSWSTVTCAFSQFWPLVAVAVALFAIGLRRCSGALLLASAFCFVAFCVAGVTLCAVPGALETFLFNMPSGRSLRFVIVD